MTLETFTAETLPTTPLEVASRAIHDGHAVVVQFGTTTGIFWDLFSYSGLEDMHRAKGEMDNVGKRPVTLVAGLETMLELIDFAYIFGDLDHEHELHRKFWSLNPQTEENAPKYIPNLDELRRVVSQVAIFRLPLRDEFVNGPNALPPWAMTFNEEEQKNYVQVVNFGTIGGDVETFFETLLEKYGVLACTSANFHGQPEIVDEKKAAEFADTSGLACIVHPNTAAFAGQPGSYTIVKIGPHSRALITNQPQVNIERHGNHDAGVIKALWGNVGVSENAQPAKYPQIEIPIELIDKIFAKQFTSYQRAFLITKLAEHLRAGHDTIDFDQLVATLEELQEAV